MAALTKDRDTAAKHYYYPVELDVAASTTIFNGSMVMVSAAGRAVPAADTVGCTVVGRAQEKVVNGADGAADGNKRVTVMIGVFKWVNNGTNSIVAADIGRVCFVQDDQTVVKAAGPTNDIIAGRVVMIDPDGGIWVASLQKSSATGA